MCGLKQVPKSVQRNKGAPITVNCSFCRIAIFPVIKILLGIIVVAIEANFVRLGKFSPQIVARKPTLVFNIHRQIEGRPRGAFTDTITDSITDSIAAAVVAATSSRGYGCGVVVEEVGDNVA